MGKVVDIETFLPHAVSEVMCIACKKRWINVFPEAVWLKNLECPHCGEVGFIINTGQEMGVQHGEI